jgi:hypothetical protein
MAIVNLDGVIAAAKQTVALTKTAGSAVGVAARWQSLFAVAGDPGAGTLAGTSTTAGVVPDDTVAGYPSLNAFGSGNLGYLSAARFGSNVACRVKLYDRLFVAGAYAFNANTTLSSPPSYTARLPASNTNGVGLEIWVELVTTGAGVQSVNVTYNNQSGTSHTTGATANPTGANGVVGGCFQLPLQSGDSGVEGITTIVGTVATVGTFNVMVLRPLGYARIKIANDVDIQDMLRTGLPQVFATTALYMLVSTDAAGAATNSFDCSLDVING